MNRSSTHDQRRWPSLLVGLALIGLASVGAWTWWLQPRRIARLGASSPELVEARDDTLTRLAARGLELSLDDASAELRWRTPSDCVEVYRVRVDEQFRDASVATLLGRDEEHSTWVLALAARARQPSSTELGAVEGLLISLGPGPDPALGESRRRELWWSASEVGPAAPDLACRPRGWDPLEDVLALAWPLLPDRQVRVGEGWQGAAVEGRCHETTCIDDQGQFSHERPCRARPWRERLAGAGQSLALILGDWDDGRGHDPTQPEIGILTSRELLFDEGRPLYVRARIDQRWSGVRRSWKLERIDDCGHHSLASEDDPRLIDEIRARLSPP